MGFLDASGVTRLVTDLKDIFAKKSEVNAKQDTLVSGTNIKTINSESLLGSGNIDAFHGRIITASLSPSNWVSGYQTVAIEGLTSNSIIVVAPLTGYYANYYYVYKVSPAQITSEGIRFRYDGTTPAYYLSVAIIIFE